MNIGTKKILAKEIIYFFSVITLIVIFWSIIEIRNSYTEKKIETISDKILTLQLQINRNDQKRDFLLEPDKKKILFNGLTELHNNGSSVEEMENYIADFESKFSIEKIKLVKKTQLIKNKKNILTTELTASKNNYLDQNEKKSNILILSLILFSILYPIRLIYKILKWSFLTIQTKV